ncbi:Ricin B-like lectin R40G3 [Zea mays]|uniref:Ricin B-like lectin R40G3 n=1 Tax=Zea mays TaxID=4577 RepID=A0A3L6FLN6_MAIZE|nr:Ricin B-like lectin R40G3 [Zea mays]
MEFPHHHHHHGHRRDDDEDDRRGPPPPVYGGYGQPPPPDPYGRAPVDPDPYGRPPPQSAYGGAGDAYGHSGQGYAPPPAYGAGGGYGNVVHVAHEVGDERPYYGGGGGGLGGAYGGGGSEYGHEGRPHHGGGGSQYGHETRPHHGGAPPVRQQTYRIYCKAGEDQYSLASRDGKVCLVRTDRDDDAQHWIKDMKYSTRVKDEEGYPAIVLVNKATGEALKHSLGQSHPVLLTRHNPDSLDESVLWTESRDVGDGFRCIRMVNNIYLNFDALHGDKDHGGVRDGTALVLWEWNKEMCDRARTKEELLP